MRLLIYGAGNIGCLYAARLSRASHEVTLLARGQRLAQLRGRGIQLEDGVTSERTTTAVPLIERLSPTDRYDCVLVPLPKHRVSEVLPILAANDRTPHVVFFGNNAAGPGEMIRALGRERVLLGFPGAAAVMHGDILRYVITSAREQATTIGEVSGARSPRVVAIADAISEAGFPVSISSNMDAWLKTHVAEVLPTLCALYRAGGDPTRLTRDDATMRLMVRSIREGYRVLRANGVPITPRNHRVFEWVPKALLLGVMRRWVNDKTASIKLGHAPGARPEGVRLAREFRLLTARSGIETPSMELLFASLDGDGRDTPKNPEWNNGRPRP